VCVCVCARARVCASIRNVTALLTVCDIYARACEMRDSFTLLQCGGWLWTFPVDAAGNLAIWLFATNFRIWPALGRQREADYVSNVTVWSGSLGASGRHRHLPLVMRTCLRASCVKFQQLNSTLFSLVFSFCETQRMRTCDYWLQLKRHERSRDRGEGTRQKNL
jgi:hypothetical protein